MPIARPRPLPALFCHAFLWGGLLILVWNEVHSAIVAAQLDVPAAISVSPATMDPSHTGKIIHLAGQLEATAPAQDLRYGIVGNAAYLRRSTEVRETLPEGHKRGTDFGWSPKPGYSLAYAPDLRLGAYRIETSAFATASPRAQGIRPTPELAEQVARAESNMTATIDRDWIVLEPAGAAPDDVRGTRVKFEQIPLGTYTIVGRQDGARVVPTVVAEGVHAPEEVLQTARAGNAFATWFTRLIAAGFAITGYHLLARAGQRIRLPI